VAGDDGGTPSDVELADLLARALAARGDGAVRLLRRFASECGDPRLGAAAAAEASWREALGE
jgi:hypothetical protein